MRISSFLSLLAILTVFICSSAVPAKASFTVAVAPHTSARVIIDMYQPLRNYLEKALNTPVDIVTAPDFDTLARRALTQSYDLVVTTGQQARLLQTDAGYLPLLTYKASFRAVVVVAANGPIHSVADIGKGTILGLSPTSQVTLWGRHWLNENGFSSLPVKFVSASDSVGNLIVSGQADAGFMSLANFQKLKPAEAQHLKILAQSKPMAGRIYLLNRKHRDKFSKIDAALWKFAETAEARCYFESNKLEGYRKLLPNELKAMDGYASEVRKFLDRAAK